MSCNLILGSMLFRVQNNILEQYFSNPAAHLESPENFKNPNAWHILYTN